MEVRGSCSEGKAGGEPREGNLCLGLYIGKHSIIKCKGTTVQGRLGRGRERKDELL